MKIAVNVRILQKNQLDDFGKLVEEVLKKTCREHLFDEFIFFFDKNYSKDFIFAPNIRPIVLLPPTTNKFFSKIFFNFSIPYAVKKYHADILISADNINTKKLKIPTIIIDNNFEQNFSEFCVNNVL